MHMTKKTILLFSLFLCMQTLMAQKMSDSDIIDFVMTEQAKGADQRTIATQLLKKGISPERLREIKKKYDAENSQLGASDLIGMKKGETVNRSRVKKEMLEDNKRKRDAGLVKSKREINRRYTKDESLDMLEGELTFLDIDSVMYYEKMLDDENETIFGHDIFNNEFLTFEPSFNVPTPADYILGVGDQVIIDIWGASQYLVDSEISPDGKIFVEGAGPLHLAGKNIEDANKYVKGILGKLYADSEISLSVGIVRSIQVQVLGEVVMPGTYTIGALSTAFNALYAAGGISDFGTLRNINVYRNGKLVSTIDVYDFIFNGNVEGNIRLVDNDVISVGAYESIVNIQGKVKRPMMYEMKEGEPMSKLVDFSGGFKGDAYKEKIRVIRKSGREYSLHTVGKDSMFTFVMHDGDSVYVDSVIPRFSNMVEIAGAVFYPGQYQFGENINSVLELLKEAGGQREDAFLTRAVLHHRNADNTIEAKSIDLKGMLDGTVPDFALRNNDILYIPSTSEMNGELVVNINGEVNYPGKYKFAENTTIEDLILQAGGLTRAASIAKVDVFRRKYNPAATENTNAISETYSFEIKNGFVVDDGERFVLKPYDEVHVRRSPVYNEVKLVKVEGAVNFEGEYALVSKMFRLSDLLKSAGGLAESAYAKGALLMRKMTEDEKGQYKKLRELSRIELYEEVLRSTKGINMALMDSIYKSKFGDNDMYPVAIDLEKAISEPGSDADIILREGDIINVPDFVSTVKIKGEVKYPTSVNWIKGKPLKYYVNHAGGYSNAAKKRGVYVVYMNGSVEKISKHSKKAIQPGCEIIIPRKAVRRMTTSEVLAIGSTSVSVVTMLATLVNLIK